MSRSARPTTGTVGTFNFIRGIGFPTTLEITSIFLTVVLFSSFISLPTFGLSLLQIAIDVSAVIVVPTLVGELAVAFTLLKGAVLNFRRLMGMELLGWGLTMLVLPIAALLERLDATISWQDGIIFVVAISLPIRFLSIVSLTNEHVATRIVSGVLVPAMVSAGLAAVSPSELYPAMLVLSIVSVLSAVGIVRLVRRIDIEGTREIGAPPMTLFRAFLEHWLNHDPSSLEANLSALGLTDSIRTSVIAFFGRNRRHKGALVVSSFHPGPYRDLGSGGLPSLLKGKLEKRFGGVVHVPHGISGHQSNIVTSTDVRKFIESVESHYPSNPITAVASPLERCKQGVASASAQVFDHTAFVTLTMSPVDMEDMPLELGERIALIADQHRLRVVVADAHNSMRQETVISAEQSEELAKATGQALGKLNTSDWGGFKTGFAQDPLPDFSLEDGVGPGGVSVLVVQVQGQKVAYLTLDGNNMEPGFREKILDSLRDLGIEDGEVMTTDTHLVTGLVKSSLGYYPVGSRLDKQLLIRRIKATVNQAVDDLEDTMLGFSSSSVEVKVLGKQTFQSVTQYIGRVGHRVRNLFYLLEAASIVATLAVLVLV